MTRPSPRVVEPSPYRPQPPHTYLASVAPYVLADCAGGPVVAWWAPWSEAGGPRYLHRQCAGCGRVSRIREDGVSEAWRQAVPAGQTATLGAGLWDQEAV